MFLDDQSVVRGRYLRAAMTDFLTGPDCMSERKAVRNSRGKV